MSSIATLMAERIILGKLTFDELPAKLKETVGHKLIEDGLEDMVPVEYGGKSQTPDI